MTALQLHRRIIFGRLLLEDWTCENWMKFTFDINFDLIRREEKKRERRYENFRFQSANQQALKFKVVETHRKFIATRPDPLNLPSHHSVVLDEYVLFVSDDDKPTMMVAGRNIWEETHTQERRRNNSQHEKPSIVIGQLASPINQLTVSDSAVPASRHSPHSQ